MIWAIPLSSLCVILGRMEVEPIDNGYVSDQASSLTLTPYAAKMPDTSGEMNSDYEPVGEAFTIQISGQE